MIAMPEADIIEIFGERYAKRLFMFIPASGQLFRLETTYEVDLNPFDVEDLAYLGQYNLDVLEDLREKDKRLRGRLEAIKTVCESWINNTSQYMDTGEVMDDLHVIHSIIRHIEAEDL